jgi:hypothetical protein
MISSGLSGVPRFGSQADGDLVKALIEVSWANRKPG